jgi:hypothetical protein
MINRLGTSLLLAALALGTARAQEAAESTDQAPAPAEEVLAPEAESTVAPFDDEADSTPATPTDARSRQSTELVDPTIDATPPTRGPAPVDPRFLPAVGSAVGPWGFFELSGALALGSLVDSPYYYSGPAAGAFLLLNGGWGVEAGPLHLRPAAQFAMGFSVPVDSEQGRAFNWSPIGLTLSATDLLNAQLTAPLGLRLTPTLGLTIPTSASYDPFLLTTISLGVQLERRFGPIELALRARAGKPIEVATTSTASSGGVLLCRTGESICANGGPPRNRWLLADSFLLEGWILESLSAGLELSWDFSWRVTNLAALDQYSCQAINSAGQSACQGGSQIITSVFTGARVFTSWAPFKYVGITLELSNFVSHSGYTPRVPFISAAPGFYPVLSLSLWVRTDPLLQRNWIEQ